MNKENMLFAFKRTSSPVAYCALSTRFGTRNEEEKYNGLAHLTEHMLFKGTSKKNSIEINSTLEKVGGELNAFTTKERIVVYSTVLKQDIKKAISLLFEIAFASKFPTDELKKEKTVVYDEIITYLDSPSDQIYDTFESKLFAGSKLGLPILGEKKTIEPITSAVLQKNLKKYFTPGNMSFTIAGDFDTKEIAAEVEKELHEWRPASSLRVVAASEPVLGDESEPVGAASLKVAGAPCAQLAQQDSSSTTCKRAGDNKPAFAKAAVQTADAKAAAAKALAAGKKFNETVEKKLRQVHCIIGCSAYSVYDKDKKMALSLLTNILGGPASNSRLNLSLREKNALVYTVEANYILYQDTGAFSIYFGCDKPFFKKCITLIKKELELAVTKKISARALAAAKKQLIGQLLIGNDNAEAQCLTMGKSLLVSGKIQPVDETVRRINSVTAEQIQSVAKEVLRWNRMSMLVFE
ncbi:MAG: insulinase family protein [Bacteroidales bacterium]|jgi:predicted Zn-dependent peptidase|nr:insulinase family protein [Bacteroidales bacterium]MCI1733803.1 insulinase family protein [Bacteroidales bacterium]